MPECTSEFSEKKFLETFLLVVDFSNTILFHRKKTKEKYQKSKGNMSLIIFQTLAFQTVNAIL